MAAYHLNAVLYCAFGCSLCSLISLALLLSSSPSSTPCPHLFVSVMVYRYGRAPAAFSRANVYLWSGVLRLVARIDPAYDFPPNPPSTPAEPRLYGNWTSAFVESVEAVRYGFFEVRSRYVSAPVLRICRHLDLPFRFLRLKRGPSLSNPGKACHSHTSTWNITFSFHACF